MRWLLAVSFISVFLLLFSLVSAPGIDNPYLPLVRKTFENVTGNLTTWLELTDTPSSYSGEGGRCVKVNGGETELEFGDCVVGSGEEPNWNANYSIFLTHITFSQYWTNATQEFYRQSFIDSISNHSDTHFNNVSQSYVDSINNESGNYLLKTGDNATGDYNFTEGTFHADTYKATTMNYSFHDDGVNLHIEFPDVGGNNYVGLETTGGFFQLYANPNPSNDYLLATITETQGADTELNFYEGGTGHNRFWDSGSMRVGGNAGYLCSELTSDVDCDTPSSGADLVVEDDGWFGGKLFSSNWENVSITESQISDLTHTVDTDTNETARIDNLTATNCTGSVMIGVYFNGTPICEPDDTGGGSGHTHDQDLNTTDYVQFQGVTVSDVNEDHANITFAAGDDDGLISYNYILDRIDFLNFDTGVLMNLLAITDSILVTNNITVGGFFVGDGSHLTEVNYTETDPHAYNGTLTPKSYTDSISNHSDTHFNNISQSYVDSINNVTDTYFNNVSQSYVDSLSNHSDTHFNNFSQSYLDSISNHSDTHFNNFSQSYLDSISNHSDTHFNNVSQSYVDSINNVTDNYFNNVSQSYVDSLSNHSDTHFNNFSQSYLDSISNHSDTHFNNVSQSYVDSINNITDTYFNNVSQSYVDSLSNHSDTHFNNVSQSYVDSIENGTDSIVQPFEYLFIENGTEYLNITVDEAGVYDAKFDSDNGFQFYQDFDELLLLIDKTNGMYLYETLTMALGDIDMSGNDILDAGSIVASDWTDVNISQSQIYDLNMSEYYNSTDVEEYADTHVVGLDFVGSDPSGANDILFSTGLGGIAWGKQDQIDHNELSGHQGGSASNYYHLTSTQHTTLTGGGDADSLHEHPDYRELTNHTFNLPITVNAEGSMFYNDEGNAFLEIKDAALGGNRFILLSANSSLSGSSDEYSVFLIDNGLYLRAALSNDLSQLTFTPNSISGNQYKMIWNQTGDKMTYGSGQARMAHVFPSLAGTYSVGKAYVCVFDNGTLFASDSAC